MITVYNYLLNILEHDFHGGKRFFLGYLEDSYAAEEINLDKHEYQRIMMDRFNAKRNSRSLQIYFTTREDIQKAYDYIESILVMKKLRGEK